MPLITESHIRLKSFSFKEESDGILEFEVSKVELGNFELFIGNNAQGKTRIFRTLRFIKELFGNTPRKISTHFEALFTFGIADKNISYLININPGVQGNIYSEKIRDEDEEKNLLSTEEKTIFDEKTGKHINTFFIPQNVIAIAAINDPRFKTIRLIKEFFLRMLFLDPENIRNEINMNQPESVINFLGKNLSSVLADWEKHYPELYKDALGDLKRCFPIIKDMKFVPVLPHLIDTKVLAINEEGINKDINQLDWSNGFWRSLLLICLPKTPFKFEDKIYAPSLICIDEIENGLDFNTLEFITDYLRDYSDDIQIIVSSHSPLMGKFIHPRNWQIVKRKGVHIKISKPDQVENNLEETLDLYRREYWDFYTNYISRSDSYEPK